MKSFQVKTIKQMNNCIKKLYDYDLVKQCCVCKKVLFKSNFQKKNRKSKDGLRSQCKLCVNDYNKNYYNKNQIQNLSVPKNITLKIVER